MRAAALISLLFVLACATGRQRLGDVRLRPYGSALATPAVFSVQKGRLVSPDVDVAIDPDGCIRGTTPFGAVQLCSKGGGAPTEEGGRVERWSGTGGDFTLELFEGGQKLRADGFLGSTFGGRPIPMQATIPLGAGPQWNELRAHPALLAIAATVAGVRGEPDNQALREVGR